MLVPTCWCSRHMHASPLPGPWLGASAGGLRAAWCMQWCTYHCGTSLGGFDVAGRQAHVRTRARRKGHLGRQGSGCSRAALRARIHCSYDLVFRYISRIDAGVTGNTATLQHASWPASLMASGLVPRKSSQLAYSRRHAVPVRSGASMCGLEARALHSEFRRRFYLPRGRAITDFAPAPALAPHSLPHF